MFDRFTGSEGPRYIRESLHEQKCIAHNAEVTDALFAAHKFATFKPGEVLIQQDAGDNDILFILAGRVSIRVNGREMALRQGGHHIGEMAMIERSAKRSATAVALEPTVVARVSEADFTPIATRFPDLWRRLAMELGDRLRERSKYVRPPNPRPVVFIGSSVEGLAIAKEIQAGLVHLDAVIYLWTNNVFVPGSYTMEDLERQINASDIGIVVCSADDEIINEDRKIDMLAPRDNCVLELGMCIGALGRKRTLLVRPRTRDLKIPTDLLGITPIEYRADDPANLPAHISPVCTAIEKVVKAQGPR